MRPLLALAALVLFGSTASAQHQHGKPGSAPEPFTATPAFGADGTLWLARPMVDRIAVLRSSDLGKTFSAPVIVTPEPMNLDWGPDARARIANQATREQRLARADFVVANDGDLGALDVEMTRLWEWIEDLASSAKTI